MKEKGTFSYFRQGNGLEMLGDNQRTPGLSLPGAVLSFSTLPVFESPSQRAQTSAPTFVYDRFGKTFHAVRVVLHLHPSGLNLQVPHFAFRWRSHGSLGKDTGP